MKHIGFTAILMFCTASSAWAQLPSYQPNVENELIQAEQLIMSNTARNALQQKLKRAVVTVYADQHKPHAMIKSSIRFDGAAVAVVAEDVAEILPEDAIQEVPDSNSEKKKKRSNGSFFNQGLDKVTSPFAPRPSKKSQIQSGWQYYLTTADWLSNSADIEINIQGELLKAKQVYRDEAQNVAVLSTRISEKIEPVQLYDAEATLPSLVFILLNPHTIYESFTQHTLHVPEMHRYGTTNMTVRNGYPLFNIQGELVGLTVGPDAANTKGFVVHPGILDRALHPKKYSRVKVEEVKLQIYDE